jgi:hypothetical protein
MDLADWLAQCKSTIIYERCLQSQVWYTHHINTAQIGACARGGHYQEASDSMPNGADGNRWRYVNTFALLWA